MRPGLKEEAIDEYGRDRRRSDNHNERVTPVAYQPSQHERIRYASNKIQRPILRYLRPRRYAIFLTGVSTASHLPPEDT